MSLRDALTAIMREHRYRRAGSTYVDGEWVKDSCQCGWEGARAAHASHIADLQIAYLRDNLAQHAEELGMTRECAAAYAHDDLVTGDEDFVRDEIDAHGGSLVTRFVTDWSRADD